MGTVVRIAAPRSTTTPPRAKLPREARASRGGLSCEALTSPDSIIRPVQFRNVSGRVGHVPPLNHLLREGRASNRRIHDYESVLPVFTDAGWFHEYASHASIDLLKGRLHFTNRNANGYTPFGHGVFVFRKKSARQAKRLTISLDDHRIGTHSSRALSGAKPLASRAG